ncbi:MAG TPA: twin-arginine translocase TatA/TatE family subunit [Solirubrobacteraceae bacterium]|jgi:sec-independent protein translocase protein TatA|nr:twin-arginine translocase TatA/TatE family subunit [Solirubrobacteraceae bacterium]
MGLDNPIHIAFLLIIMLLVFGAKRLPEMGRSLGDGMRGFKDALGGEHQLPAHEALTQSMAAQAPAVIAPAPAVAAPAQGVAAPAQGVAVPAQEPSGR